VPLIGGRAVKGPADRMLARLAGGTTPAHVAACYEGLIDVLVVDEADEPSTPVPGLRRTVVTQTLDERRCCRAPPGRRRRARVWCARVKIAILGGTGSFGRALAGRLAALGLVSFEPNRGVRVRTLSHHDLREAFLVRAELESLATEIAATKMTEESLHELDAAAKRFSRLTQELRSREPGEERRTVMGDWVRANHALPRCDLPIRRVAARRAAREERSANVQRPGRVGARRPLDRRPLLA